MFRLFIFLLCSFVAAFCFQPSEKYDHQISLSKKTPTYELYWKIVGDEIVFEMQVETKGWVGLGFSQNGGMPGSDIVIGGFKDNKPYLNDYHATGNQIPVLDQQQDYTLLYATENSLYTILKFKRKLSTCDKDDFVITQDTIRVIWGIGEKDIENATNFNMHSNRGTKSVMLMEQGKTTRTAMPRDVITYDLNVTNVSIPADLPTLYLCKIFKLPQKPKHHIIKYEAVLSPGSERFMHHIVVFHCLYDMSKFVDKQEPCFSEDQTTGSEMYKCTSRYMAGWGIGADPVVYGDDLGYPIFEKNRSPYVMIEFHYNNPDRVEGAYDSSGMRFYLTPTLRPNEIGSLIMGTGFDNNSIMIPPGQKKITLSQKCDFKCTHAFPKSGINLVGAWLHEHALGISIKLKHFRNGTELDPIFDDNSYDFRYQEQRYLSEPRLVLPNDTLVVECGYNSEKRRKMTFGGYGSTEEMCLMFVDYFPKIEMLSCLGGPTQHAFAEAFNVKIIKEQQGFQPIVIEGKDGSNVSLPYYATTLDWDTLMKNDSFFENFQNKLNNGQYYEYCSTHVDENETKPALNDLLGRVAGQSVFNPDGVKLIENLREEIFMPFALQTPPSKMFDKPNLCKVSVLNETVTRGTSPSSVVTNATVDVEVTKQSLLKATTGNGNKHPSSVAIVFILTLMLAKIY